MTPEATGRWLERLGYAAEPALLHVRGEAVPETHPYALEIRALLRPDGGVRAQAVFDVEGVPTVVFVGDGGAPLTKQELDEARQRVWNQNLATVIIEVKGDIEARALPVRKLRRAEERLSFDDARPDGPFSAFDVASANLSRRIPKWFDTKARVDSKLLSNLSASVTQLAKSGFSDATTEDTRRPLAELLMGQLLFVSYLEHRQIVGPTYRERRGVVPLPDLVARGDRSGVRELIDHLRSDFNGDFLGSDRHDPWAALTDAGFRTLHDFLRRTDMRTGQGDFWNYDFSYIPVELLSGLYESFLSAEQRAKDGAYYTPRNLAVLAVEQALLASPDPLSETVFDGACGSGILLTTAYRRLIALAEQKAQRSLGFAERSALLTRQIFGGDINLMACRVTAFSLYLSLLEGLDPADIMEAQEREGVRLPALSGSNLVHGPDRADFFKEEHAFAGRRFSVIVSNPPWAEPAGTSRTAADEWAARADAPFVRRQIAGAYALRALDFLDTGGRVCLILPIGQLLGPSSVAFVRRLFLDYQPSRLINFGDLQGLLFPSAENTCHVFVASRRSDAERGLIPFGETFDYCIPKADMSLALGRLTMQSADRHTLQTRSVADDPQLLVTTMWGDARDLAIWTRLSTRGTFADLWSGSRGRRRWTSRKGIHLNDQSRDPVSAELLRGMKHVPIAALSAGSPVLHPDLLGSWPAEQETVVGLTDDVLRVFDGPRVLFPDGFSKEDHNIRAVFFDGEATFTHSVGVISGPPRDEALLQFAAVYLRSSLARYFLMMRGWKMLAERNGIHLTDVAGFPFFLPDQAPDPDAATAALAHVSQRVAELVAVPQLLQGARYGELRPELDEAVFNYFGLDEAERALVRETVEILLPSIRPRSFKSLDTPAQHIAGSSDFEKYAKGLGDALTSWRTKAKGRGRFEVQVTTGDPRRAGPSGVVRVRYAQAPTKEASIKTEVSDDLVAETLAQLRTVGLRAIPSGDMLTLVPDVYLWLEDSLYVVRALTRRNWSLRQALRDAEHIVRTVQRRAATVEASTTATLA